MVFAGHRQYSGIVSIRRRFFRTRPTLFVALLLVLTLVAEIVGFHLQGTPPTFKHIRGLGRIAEQHTHTVDYVKLAIEVGGLALLLAAGLLHGDRLTTPAALAEDGPDDLDPAARGKVGTPNQIANTRL